jgi:hypothetical protein
MSPNPATAEIPWRLSLEGPDLAAIAHWLVHTGWQDAVPQRLQVNHQNRTAKEGWLEALGKEPSGTVAVYWTDSPEPSLVWHPKRCVAATFPVSPDVPQRLAQLEDAPFQVAAFGSIHPQWLRAPLEYRAPSFGDNHFRLGWGCAFKGAGHDRLVSRRWPRHGPWKRFTGRNDTSLIQFHDLGADARRALAQAKPGHELIGLGDESGFLQRNYVFEKPPKGLYSASERMLRIVVTGRPPSALEMLDACAAKRFNALGPDKPLERIAYIFPDAAVAKAHLHALWVRELECVALVNGVEKRLDESYNPPDSTLAGWPP